MISYLLNPIGDERITDFVLIVDILQYGVLSGQKIEGRISQMQLKNDVRLHTSLKQGYWESSIWEFGKKKIEVIASTISAIAFVMWME